LNLSVFLEMKMSAFGIREQIFQNNPFFSGIASDPWDNTDPDVPSLNEEACRHLCGLVLAKSRNPCAASAGLILGEAGMGKTHLLKRLLRYVRKEGIAALFASITPLPDPGSPMRHLLREIALDLSGRGIYEDRRTKPLTRRSVTQFDYLLDKAAAACRKDEEDSKPRTGILRFLSDRFLSDRFPGARLPGARLRSGAALLRERCRGIHPRLLGAVFGRSDPRQREAVLEWLENGARAEGEEEARRVLVSLGMLLEYCGMSLIVCFDQLDGMRDDALITAFGDTVHFLVNDVKGMLPLAFVRMNTWSDRFSRLDPAVTQRLSGNEMFLYACTLEQARELIRVRLESRFKGDTEEKFQWLMERLEGKLKAGYSPRAVIELANREIVREREPEKEPLEKDPIERELAELASLGGEPRGGEPRSEEPAGEPFNVSNSFDVSNAFNIPNAFDTLDLVEPSDTSSAGPSLTGSSLTEDGPGAILEVFADEYRKARKKADAGVRRSPDPESLVRALETCLLSRADFTDVRRTEDGYIALTARREGGGACAFIVSTQENHRAVQTALARGVSFLWDHPDGECFCVAAGRQDFRLRKNWPSVQKELQKFLEAKGTVFYLNRRQAAAWYALAALRLEVDRGNIRLPAPDGKQRAAQIEDLALFLRQSSEKDLPEWWDAKNGL
jgi:hypothetical protein